MHGGRGARCIRDDCGDGVVEGDGAGDGPEQGRRGDGAAAVVDGLDEVGRAGNIELLDTGYGGPGGIVVHKDGTVDGDGFEVGVVAV